MHISEDNIRMYLVEVGWEGVNWMNLAQDRAVVNTVMKLGFNKRRGIS
jgi:uncharacterized protein YqjF (DUF2071 family)